MQVNQSYLPLLFFYSLALIGAIQLYRWAYSFVAERGWGEPLKNFLLEVLEMAAKSSNQNHDYDYGAHHSSHHSNNNDHDCCDD